MRRQLTPPRIAAASTAIVFVAAFSISWESLRVLALAAGIQGLLAPLYPLTIDALMVTGTVAAVALRTAHLRTRLHAWTLITARIADTVMGNAVHSQAHGGVLNLPWWAAAGASAVPALSLAASLHLLVIIVRSETHSAGRRPSHVSSGATSRTSSSSQRVQRLLAGDPDVSVRDAARRLRLSRSQADRLLQDLRRPHMVEDTSRPAPCSTTDAMLRRIRAGWSYRADVRAQQHGPRSRTGRVQPASHRSGRARIQAPFFFFTPTRSLRRWVIVANETVVAIV